MLVDVSARSQTDMTSKTATLNAELCELMLYVTCCRVWKQQQQNGTGTWACIGVQHPFVQLEPTFARSPGEAIVGAYNAWKAQNS